MIEAVRPSVDGGRFAAKRTVGDTVVVEAEVFADGHDLVTALLRHRPPNAGRWTELAMDDLGNDAWQATFVVRAIGRHEFTVVAWADAWKTWRHDLRKRLDAAQDVSVDLLIGTRLVVAATARATPRDRKRLSDYADAIAGPSPIEARAAVALDGDLDALMTLHADRSEATEHPVLAIVVDPVRARFSSWYEMFPRSASPDPGRHGTFQDVIERLPRIDAMGFDVLYLPPIHPIGRTFRKGPNNVASGSPDDPGVPWAIGAEEGGHEAINPDLGTVDDFRALVAAARGRGIDIALDLAFQASPDHPAVREHPTWFRQRPDGTVQYAENPPKKYQDIYPFDFESEDWAGLWQHLRDVVLGWVDLGVRIFRVDNPHTKPFAFWEWLITGVKAEHPDVLFLAEAFTRPKVMYRLGKVGFTQSYTYFTWRNSAWELRTYLEEITQPPVSEFFRPNFWPNTPDILHETLQHGGRAAFEGRLILAATLTASYGIYGPAFELQEHTPLAPGSEEYLDSEKYQVRHWNLDDPASLEPLISRVNRIRRDHPALQRNRGLRFHPVDNEAMLAYTKRSADGEDMVLVVVNLDWHHQQSGTVELDLDGLALDGGRPFEAEDLIEGTVELWTGSHARVELDPAVRAGVILRLGPQARTETQFETYR